MEQNILKATIRKQRHDALDAAHVFVEIVKSGEANTLYGAACNVSETVDGWRRAMAKVAKLSETSPAIQAAFVAIWIEWKTLPLAVGSRATLARALRLLMPRAGIAEPIRIYRGATGREHKSRSSGFSWSTRLDVARKFAEHWQSAPNGGVVLETVAAPEAVLLMCDDYNEAEVVVDPYALRRVKMLETFR